jgi:crossover junction endodeoxyribonuclease RuvC
LRLLGIDPGSRYTGFACIESVEGSVDWQLKGAGVLKPNLSEEFSVRLGELLTGFQKLLKEFEPDQIILEKAFVHKNVSSALKLGEVRGAYLASAMQDGRKVGQIAPKRVKKLITGSGNASKEFVATCVGRLLKQDFSGAKNDVTDAIAIALSCSLSQGDAEWY